MSEKISEFKKAPFPVFPGILAALGPGIVWMALAQGSGELIWWPYIVAKYGLGFLFLLIPACFLQYPLNYHIARYTILTGESIFQGFIRLNRLFAFFLWILMTVSFLWLGAFVSAGGTAISALTNFPQGWTPREQTLFWSYITIPVFVFALLFSRIIYRTIEKIMFLIAIITTFGLLLACLQHDVISSSVAFFKGLIKPEFPLPRKWDPEDTTKLLTAITFAGLGGFWILFYSYWLREKGSGMSKYFGHITSPITGKPEIIPDTGFVPDDSRESQEFKRRWERYIVIDSGIGIVGNLFTTLMTCLLAYALLFPKGLLPEHYEIAVVQAKFFESSWGIAGRVLFLIIAAAFLSDTWLTTADAVSRVHTDFVYAYFPSSRKFSVRTWYYIFLTAITIISLVTLPINEPGVLIQLSAVIGFLGTILFPFLLFFLNYVYLPKIAKTFGKPGRFASATLIISGLFYLILAILYFGVKLSPQLFNFSGTL
jgi:hypothetical protein